MPNHRPPWDLLASLIASEAGASDDRQGAKMDEDQRSLLERLQMITSTIASLRSAYMPTDLRKHLERAEASAAVLSAKIKSEMGLKARLLHRARQVRGRLGDMVEGLRVSKRKSSSRGQFYHRCVTILEFQLQICMAAGGSPQRFDPCHACMP